MRRQTFAVNAQTPLEGVIEKGTRLLRGRLNSGYNLTSEAEDMVITVWGDNVRTGDIDTLLVHRSLPTRLLRDSAATVREGVTRFGGKMQNLISAIRPTRAVNPAGPTNAKMYSLRMREGEKCDTCGTVSWYKNPSMRYGLGGDISDADVDHYAAMLFALDVAFTRTDNTIVFHRPLPHIDAGFHERAHRWVREQGSYVMHMSESLDGSNGLQFLESLISYNDSLERGLNMRIIRYAHDEQGDRRVSPISADEYRAITQYVGSHFQGVPSGNWTIEQAQDPIYSLCAPMRTRAPLCANRSKNGHTTQVC